MIFAKSCVLLLVASVVDSAWRVGDGCTKHTDWQQKIVKRFHSEALAKNNMNFRCDCAERAEGVAYAKARNATTDAYEKVYDVYTTTLVGRPLQNQYHQVLCMLDKLRNQENLKSKVEDGRTFGCSYSRYPDAPQIADNISQALTCIYVRDGKDNCYH